MFGRSAAEAAAGNAARSRAKAYRICVPRMNKDRIAWVSSPPGRTELDLGSRNRRLDVTNIALDDNSQKNSRSVHPLRSVRRIHCVSVPRWDAETRRAFARTTLRKVPSMKFMVASLLVAGMASMTLVASAAAPRRVKAPCEVRVVAEEQKKDIVDTAVEAGKFKTLAAALKAAGLIETLKGKGPFTVFAPTDEAFAKLPKGTVEELLKPENKEKLVAVLTYHVVPGKVLAADVVKLTDAKTVQGGKVTIAVKDGKVKVDGATVVKTDIEASNGVIHVIDAVILPK